MRTFLRFFRRHFKTIEELEISRRPGAISNILREIADTCEGVPRIRAFVNSSFGKKILRTSIVGFWYFLSVRIGKKNS